MRAKITSVLIGLFLILPEKSLPGLIAGGAALVLFIEELVILVASEWREPQPTEEEK